jgi:hypothetical protein
MTDEDAENFEDYIIPPDQQLILDKLNMPLFTDQRANSNGTTRLSHDLKKCTDELTALLPISDDHSITDTLLDDEFTDEFHGTHHNTQTLVDETQQDGTDDDNDDDDDDDIDPSGGFELDVVLNTQNTTVRSMRNSVTITETLPDEHVSPSFSRKDTSTPPNSVSLGLLSQASDRSYPTESSASKRRTLDANWLTQPQTQGMMTQDMMTQDMMTQDMMTQDMMSQGMMSYPDDTYSHLDQDPVTQASQILLPSAVSPGRLRGGRKATTLGEKLAEDELYDETMIGRKIIKTFGRHGTFEGYVQRYCG